MFITLEGVEGSGKTTLAQNLKKSLETKGLDVLLTREPGGNPIAEAIRNVILDQNNTMMDGRTEALLYAAARRQHLVEVVEPALSIGKIVICDRFVDSSIAYQGVAREIGADSVAQVNDFATAGRAPDLTFLIDIKPEVGLARINADANREINRLDLEALDFHQLVYEGYQTLAMNHPDRIKVINGELPAVELANEVTSIIFDTLKGET